MSDQLVVEWGRERIGGVAASVASGRVAVKTCFDWAWPEDQQPATDPEQAGRWLKERLAELRIAAKRVVVLVPREDVVVKRLELPEAPDEELPDLVRFQAAAKSALPLEQVCLDFLPLPRRPELEGRDALMVTVAKKLADSAQAVLAAAGLEMTQLGMASTGIAELVVRAAEQAGLAPEATMFILVRHGDRCELLVTQQQHVIFAHATRLTGGSWRQMLLTEISRASVVLQERYGEFQFDQAWLISDQDDDLLQAMEARLQCEARTLDPLASSSIELPETGVPDERAGLAPLVGQLLAVEEAKVPAIDFLHPRQRPVERDLTKPRLIAAGAGLCILLIGMFVLRAWQIKALDRAITVRQDQQEKLTEELKELAPQVEEADAVAAWIDRAVNCLELTKEIAETLKGTERYYLIRLAVDQGIGRVAATVNANGVAKDRRDIETLYMAFMQRKRYEVQPSEISRNSPDTEYPFRFELTAELLPPEKEAKDSRSGGTEHASSRRGRPRRTRRSGNGTRAR
ncbi:MAG: pilus assembly protein PilM [Planctomycetes bacterium]|nr:pilus assembly protein PilM [Planctomycetota bacterium]